ncbi:UNKNOWN [Stylonychia lemnae]|uniref:Uncharacterized protein n=1 Tax=Stylonychia lemnae TaxID=5949 RepID=A0A077ZQL7_STYLE|nr:UNKNOWN [Stylonychia lemnae]|eukprot:CDW71675.1 UNKNOWN [Stylonychia lemnae]
MNTEIHKFKSLLTFIIVNGLAYFLRQKKDDQKGSNETFLTQEEQQYKLTEDNYFSFGPAGEKTRLISTFAYRHNELQYSEESQLENNSNQNIHL